MSQRIQVTIPQKLYKYKSVEHRCRVLREDNPHLEILNIAGCFNGDIKLFIELPEIPEAQEDYTDNPFTDPSYEVLDELAVLGPRQAAATA